MSGRPSMRSADLCERILRLLSEGKTFRWFDSEEAVGLPSTATIRRWRQEDEDFDAKCVRACEASADADYDRMEELEERALLPKSDARHLDPYAVNVVLGNTRWRMERRKARTYGAKLEVKGKLTLEQLVLASQPAAEDPEAPPQ